MADDFKDSPANENDAHKVEAKPDVQNNRCKGFDLLDFRHNLGNPVEHAHAGQCQCESPDQLKKTSVVSHSNLSSTQFALECGFPFFLKGLYALLVVL